MPSELTTTSHAVLGLLAVRPWSAYELAQQVDRSLGWFWPRTPRKIYDEAKRLENHDLATSTREMTGRRPRSVYDITPRGREVLDDWLGQTSVESRFESEAMVRTFFADSGSLEQLRATLTEAAGSAEERLEVLTAMMESMGEEDYSFVERRHLNVLAMRFGLDNHRALADWARWALAQTDSWTSTRDPGTWDWRHALDVNPPDGSG